MILDEKKKKKDCSSITHTTGDIGANIRHFNRCMGTDFNNPSTEEAKANIAAKKAADSIRTISAASPDGGNSVDTISSSVGEGTGMGEALTEAKRYVRRYYIRPQNIFCSNKTEILQALIQFEDKDCIVYTLNNLGDEKDTTKLTNNDIIYYYQDGILYDKNMMRLMDYDLYIKHEEERPKINIETASDSSLSKVYADRLTGLTGMDEAFSLNFADVNVYGEILTEGKTINNICCICGEKIEGYGNNPEPYMTAKNGERCCDACNLHYVIPARLEQLEANKED